MGAGKAHVTGPGWWRSQQSAGWAYGFRVISAAH
jgi:hypothetical protein